MATASDFVTRAKIEPLKSPEDWTIWSIQMEDLLWETNLWPYVSGTKKRPVFADGHTVTTGEQAQLDEWDKKDRSALSGIRTRTGKGAMKIVMNCRTSRDAWEKLRKNFETHGLAKVLDVKRKISGTPYSDGEDLDAWLQQMVEWREELTSLGRNIPDDEFSITLLTALPESWRAFTNAVQDQEILDADKLQGRIREHARRIGQTSEAALVAKTKGTATSRAAGGGDREGCYGCGQPGHIKRFCPERKKKSGSGGQSDGKRGDGGRKDNHKKKGGSRALVSKEESDSDSDSSSDYAYALIEEVDDAAEFALTLVGTDAWIADSATTSHVARERRMFTDYRETPGKTLQGAGSTPILGRGTIRFTFRCKDKDTTVTLRDVIHAPGVPHNLISVGRVEASGHRVELSGGEIRFTSSKGRVYAIGKRIGNYLYEMDGHAEISTMSETSCAAAVCRPKWKPTYNQWHCILGHPGMKAVIAMHKKGLVTGMEVDESEPPMDQCEACVQGKQTVAPYPKKSETEFTEIGEMTVMDTWGPASTKGIRGEQYWWAFTDGKGRRSRPTVAEQDQVECRMFGVLELGFRDHQRSICPRLGLN